MPRGRPKKPIDYELVAKMANIACTEAEIAAMLDVSVRKLQKDKEFIRIYKKGLENARSSLRRWQFKSAANGNVTMQIWLGKQMLGQRDPDKKNLSGSEIGKGDGGVTIINDLPPAVEAKTGGTEEQPAQTDNEHVGPRLEPSEGATGTGDSGNDRSQAE